MTPARVVSLVPSATETLLHLAVVPVACTRFCDQPGIPTVGGTKNPDVDAIAALEPDLVVVNDEENRAADARALRDRGVPLHEMSPRAVEDVGAAVCALAAAVGVEPPPPYLPGSFAAWLDAERSRALAKPVRAFVPVWRRPWMTMNGDTYGSSVLALLGAGNAFATEAERYPRVTLRDAALRDPDLVLLPSEPYAFSGRHAVEVAAAIPRAAVEFVDGRDLFWWGIRTRDAVDRLRTALGLWM